MKLLSTTVCCKGKIEKQNISARSYECCYNVQEARALLGRLEYQKGNIEAAFRVFEGIDIDAVAPNIKVSLARRSEPQRLDPQSGAVLPMSMHAVNLLFEAIFLKAKSLQTLGRSEGILLISLLFMFHTYDYDFGLCMLDCL